jgi:HprK-related kinase A
MSATRGGDQSSLPGGRLRFRIGSVGISVTSELDEALEDLAVLYGDGCESRAGSDPTIQMEVRKGRRSLLGGRRYGIWGDGEELFADRRRNEVLPYVEWGINWRVIAARTEYLQLHAATLARDGQAVVFAGPSGTGKSTLAAGLLSRGWSYLSDEFALIDPDTRLVHPFPKALCVKAGAFAEVERLKLPIWRRRHYVKAFKGRVGYISTRDIAPQVQTRPCPIRFIIFPRYAEGTETRLFSMPRGRAAFLLAQHVLNRQALGGRVISTLSDVVRDAQCLRLEAGALEATCDRIESLLSSCAPRRGCGPPG